ncbi:MAG: hypothetical protein PsegKO_31000 [Pseudohongiellaceae bacterium]
MIMIRTSLPVFDWLISNIKSSTAKLFTGSDGATHVRMSDSALIALRCNSSLKIEDYWYEDNVARDTVTLRLLSGSIRMISGAIPNNNTRAFRLLVNGTEISIRGTDFEVSIEPEDQTIHVGVFDGGVSVANQLGRLDLSVGEDVSFARIQQGLEPVGLVNYSGRDIGC